MTLVRFQSGGNIPPSEVQVGFKFNRELVDLLKNTAYQKSWNPETKQWTVDTVSAEILKTEIARLGHEIEIVNPQMRTIEARDFFGLSDKENAECVNRAVKIIDSIPAHLRGKIFREMAKLLYPDLYGKKKR